MPDQNPCDCGCAGPETPNTAKTSKSALWSLICGIGSLLICFAVIPAVILGFVGLTKIKKSNGALKGNGLAITGLVMGVIMMAFWVIVGIIAAIAIPNLIKARETALTYKSMAEIRNLATAIESYYVDNGVYPTDAQGLQILLKNSQGYSYLDAIPNDSWGRRYHYRYPGINNPGSYDLWSDGKDGIEGTGDDIANWKE